MKKEFQFNPAEVNDLEKFYIFFADIIKYFFYPEYTKRTLKYFLEKEYTKESIKRYIKDKNLLIAKAERNIVGFLLFDNHIGGISFCPWIALIKGIKIKV